MVSNYNELTWPIRIILILAIVIIFLTGGLQVHANGSHPGSQEVFSDTASTFPIRVLMVPTVGNGHMNILLDSSGTNVNTQGVQVLVTSQSPTGKSYGQQPILATPAFGSPGWYSANLPLNEPGEWEFAIEITDGEIRTIKNFLVNIRSNSDTNWPIVIALLLFSLIFIWTIILRLRRRQLRNGNNE